MDSMVTPRGETQVVVSPPLSQAVGYIVVVVVGFVFAVGKCL